jgi:hypothetical protein
MGDFVAPTTNKSQGSRRTIPMVLCASLFSQLVALFNKTQFYHLVKKHKAERYSKGYSSWDQFVAMLFCQLAQDGIARNTHSVYVNGNETPNSSN